MREPKAKIEREAPEPEALIEQEPRYLRRQKPLEVRRRKFGKRNRRVYLRYALLAGALLAVATVLYLGADFLLSSPRLALASPEQVVVRGSAAVPRAAVLEKFYPDRNRSVLQVPLAERQAELEQIPWVERATVRRVLPNRIEVDLVERTPVAFLRLGPRLALVDAYGVILEPRPGADYRFPVVTGINQLLPREERQRRMQLFVRFLEEIEQVRPGAADGVSEVDLSDPADLQAVLAGLPEQGRSGSGQATVLVHFGNGGFRHKYTMLMQNFREWRAKAGRMESVDLRFEGQAVVNPESRP